MTAGTFSAIEKISTITHPYNASVSWRWRMSTSLLLLLLAVFSASRAAANDHADYFCQSTDESDSTWLDLHTSEDFLSGISTVRELIDKLRKDLFIPLSFIEDESNELLSLPADATTLDGLAGAVAKQYGYRCEIISGRLVLRSADPIFNKVVPDVNVADMPRLSALNYYIDHLKKSDSRFESWTHPFWAGVAESPVFQDPVTLAPRAPLVQHLVQLLGRNKTVYFDLPAAHQPKGRLNLGARTINVHAVAHLDGRGPGEAEMSDFYCRGEKERGSTLLEYKIPEGLAENADTVRALVRKLRQELDLPISFIEARANEPISLPTTTRILEELLQAIVDQQKQYRCQAFAWAGITNPAPDQFPRTIRIAVTP